MWRLHLNRWKQVQIPQYRTRSSFTELSTKHRSTHTQQIQYKLNLKSVDFCKCKNTNWSKSFQIQIIKNAFRFDVFFSSYTKTHTRTNLLRAEMSMSFRAQVLTFRKIPYLSTLTAAANNDSSGAAWIYQFCISERTSCSKSINKSIASSVSCCVVLIGFAFYVSMKQYLTTNRRR